MQVVHSAYSCKLYRTFRWKSTSLYYKSPLSCLERSVGGNLTELGSVSKKAPTSQILQDRGPRQLGWVTFTQHAHYARTQTPDCKAANASSPMVSEPGGSITVSRSDSPAATNEQLTTMLGASPGSDKLSTILDIA